MSLEELAQSTSIIEGQQRECLGRVGAFRFGGKLIIKQCFCDLVAIFFRSIFFRSKASWCLLACPYDAINNVANQVFPVPPELVMWGSVGAVTLFGHAEWRKQHVDIVGRPD